MDIQPNRIRGSFVRGTHLSQADETPDIGAGDQTRDRNGDGRQAPDQAEPTQDECDLSTTSHQKSSPTPSPSADSGENGTKLDFKC